MDHTVLGCSPSPAPSSEDLRQVIGPLEPHFLICRMGIISGSCIGMKCTEVEGAESGPVP